MSRATILIADDCSDIRTIMKYSLSDLGYVVVEATDGHEAVRLARQCRPGVILLDLCMPGIDGWEVAARLRGDPALEEVPIIAMTAYDVSSAVRAAYTAGCRQVIAKPFDLNEVTNAVASLASESEPRTPQYA
jgi:CheY-like chemotaxis protein